MLVPLATVTLLRTDIGFKTLKGYFGKIHPRSSFALKFTDVGGGVTDADYRGPVSVIFFSFSADLLRLKLRFAQIIFQKIAANPTLREVEKSNNKTQRDSGSFESSGL